MYFRLDWKIVPPDRSLANTGTCPDLGVPWTMGMKLPPLPEPIVCELNPARGRRMRDMFLTDIPLFSDRLLELLGACGVDNLDTYQAEIRSPEGEQYTNYRAVNILGLVSCADLRASEYLRGSEAPMIEFQRLVIDEKRAMGLPMFRLAESSLFILVSDCVKERLEAAGLVGVRLEAIATSG